MKYLVLAPDYTSSCIRDEFNGSIELSKLNLPVGLESEINEWHSLYKKIIPLGLEERKLRIREIDELDRIGIELVKKIEKSMTDKIKIRYFSESKLRFLSVD